MAERGTSGYIPKNEQVQEQIHIPEQRRQQEHISRGLRRVKQVGALMFVLLAADLGIVAAAKTTDSHEPEVHPQTITNLINNSSYENSANPPTNSVPQSWTAGTSNNLNVPAPHYDYGTAGFDGNSSIDTEGYVTDVTCSTDTSSWEQSFPATPNNSYTLSLADAYEVINGSPSGSDFGPRVIVTWKNSNNQPTGSDDYTFAHSNGIGPDTWENNFSRTYGSGGIPIPAGTTTGVLQVGVGFITPGSCTVGTEGKEFIDVVKVMGPQPTASVGGIAEMPNLPPAATLSHSSTNTLVTNVEIAVGSAAALAAAAVAGAEINKRRKHRG